MNAKQLVIASVVVAAAGAALVPIVAWGAPHKAAPSRADVAASVVQARMRGELRPAGEAAEYRRHEFAVGGARSRADVNAEVMRARAERELVAAGEAATPDAGVTAAPSTLARATVKEEVRLARAHGELIPSGEGFGPTERAHPAAQEPNLALGILRRWR
jgi:hypothetical protein